MDVKLQVGSNFRKLREVRGLTQEQVSEMTGVSQQYVSDLERGRRNPTILTLYELTSPLGAHPRDMFEPITEQP
jgi:transcriptional regulator with XRE-family HTH domain